MEAHDVVNDGSSNLYTSIDEISKENLLTLSIYNMKYYEYHEQIYVTHRKNILAVRLYF